MDFKRIIRAAAFAVFSLSSSAAMAGSIIVAPGASPAGGYLPLSLFGISPFAAGDNTQTNFAVPTFNFAGQSWTSVNLDSNGYLVVGGAAGVSSPLNSNFPDIAAPNNVLAPFWTDLDPTLGGAMRIGLLTDGVSTWIVADWQNVVLAGGGAASSFEVWIGLASNPDPDDISFVYGTVANPAFLTVGAEDVTGTVGDAYYYNGTGTAPTNGTQLSVTSRDMPVPEPVTLSLFGTGLAGVVAVRRRKKTAKA